MSHKTNAQEEVAPKNEQIEIVQLDKSNLSPSIKLRDSIFPSITSEEHKTLEASLDIKSYDKWAKNIGIKTLQYWLAKAKSNDEIYGIVGLYEEFYGKDGAVWLGWYGVAPYARGLKIGLKLLEFAINQATLLGYKELLLYTTNEDEYSAARNIYENKGFVLYDELDNGTLYYRYSLQNS